MEIPGQGDCSFLLSRHLYFPKFSLKPNPDKPELNIDD
jgi:hypothetical protein